MTDSRWPTRARDVFAALVDLVLPAACAGCGAQTGGAVLCRPCARHLAYEPMQARPDPCPPGLPPTFAVTSYDGVARAALLAHKERGCLALARPLGAALATAVEAAIRVHDGGDGLSGSGRGQPLTGWGRGPRAVLLVPVPTTRAAVRQRGHDPTGRIAAVATAVLRRRGFPVRRLAVLRHRRGIADQSGLSAAQRAANLQGAFHVSRGRAHRLGSAPVIVLDDVLTTGATISEASRALRAVGAHVPGAAVIAATQRRHRSALSEPPTGRTNPS